MIGLLARPLADCVGRMVGIAAVVLAPALPAAAPAPEFLEPNEHFRSWPVRSMTRPSN
jgi:hypothetical protein